jgi:2-polyprenyl-6-hydroxyphenyl methylase/3-demethylubiquinone-9 3-methyltransferase
VQHAVGIRRPIARVSHAARRGATHRASSLHESVVAERFDQLRGRFKSVVAEDDVRLAALRSLLEPLSGRRILDLGCGKGRFAARLAAEGAEIVGLDLSAGMLAEAVGLDRVRASARRLPFAAGSFDAVIAIEVFEHLAFIDDVVREARRVLRPGGSLAVVDKNATSMNVDRPWLPSLLVKWIDERRGRWMYPRGGPVRERWFWPKRFRKTLRREFDDVHVAYLLSPREARWWLFRRVPRLRLLAVWTATIAGRPE